MGLRALLTDVEVMKYCSVGNDEWLYGGVHSYELIVTANEHLVRCDWSGTISMSLHKHTPLVEHMLDHSNAMVFTLRWSKWFCVITVNSEFHSLGWLNLLQTAVLEPVISKVFTFSLRPPNKWSREVVTFSIYVYVFKKVLWLLTLV